MTIITNPNVVDLPQYLNFENEATQRRYQEILSLILTQWFNSDGFFQPSLTTTQANAVFALNPPLGTHWYNSTLDKMQFVGAAAIQTITSV